MIKNLKTYLKFSKFKKKLCSKIKKSNPEIFMNPTFIWN